MSSGHPLAKKEKITEQDLLMHSIVICNSYEIPALVADIQNQFSHKFSPDAANYCENIPTMLTLIRAGYGIGLLPEIPSVGDDIIYIPMEQPLSLSYGFFYKKKIGNSVTEKFLSLTK
jgi:DNA-binding transcriptional LysR family regulator